MASTISLPSASNIELPMLTPLSFFKKVKAIPPPMIISLHLSSKFMISWILSLTLAPPMMTRRGLAGFSRTLAKYSISLPIRRPAARLLCLMPTIEE